MKSALDRWAGLREQRAGVRSARARSNSEGGAAAGVGGEDPVFGSLSPERARVLLIIAARSSACAMLVLAAAVLITLLTTHSALTGASGAIAVGWFAIHQVPVVVSSTSLALLPLVPTVAVLWLTMRDCAHAVSPQASRADLGWIVGAAVIGPLLITAICLAVVQDAAVTVPVQAPSSLSAFCTVGALHLVAAITGIATRRNPMRDLIASGLPDWVYSGARIAVGSLWRLLAAAAAVVLVSLVLHWSVLGDIYSAAGGFAGRLGLTVLSLLYLPNVAVAASSVLLGADVHIGVGALSVFSVTGAPVPAVPILAAVPGGPAAGWWPALLVIPAVVGVRGGLRCARESADVARAPWATLFSAALSAPALAVSGLFAGGEVGSFGEIGPGVAVTAALVFAWFTVTGYAGLLWGRRFLGIPAVPARHPGLVSRLGPGRRLAGRSPAATLPAYADTGYESEDEFADYADRYDSGGYDEHGYNEHEYNEHEHNDDGDQRSGAGRGAPPQYIDQLYDDPRYVEYEWDEDWPLGDEAADPDRDTGNPDSGRGEADLPKRPGNRGR